MTAIIIRALVTVLASGALLYSLTNPTGGLLWRSPISVLACGMIGLGLCRALRQRRLTR